MRSAFCYVTDLEGLELTRHSIAATILTQQSVKTIVVFCVDFEPSLERALALLAVQNEFELIIRSLTSDGAPVSTVRQATHVTQAANLKIVALDKLAAEFDRALYLDSDILLMSDINLSEIDFDGNPIAAVYDIAEVGGLAYANFHDRCRRSGRSPHYFNSGFIAVDFAKWDKPYLSLFRKSVCAHNLSCDYEESCRKIDQCSFNMTFERQWKRLPLTYNFQACGMFSERWRYAKVRHYVGKQKFIPRKARRCDDIEKALVDRVRLALGASNLGFYGSELLMLLNRVRHRAFTRLVCEAIESADEMMSCEV